MQNKRTPLIVLVALVGCSAENFRTPTSLSTITQKEIDQLVRPIPGAQAWEYQAKSATLRLFGIQPGDDSVGPSATLADTSSWETRTYLIGDAIGRNLIVFQIGDDQILLVEGNGDLQPIAVGEDVEVRQVLHRFDQVAQEEGRHQWTADAAGLAEIESRYGLGIEVQDNPSFTPNGLEVVAIDPQGLLAHFGIQEGDLILDSDGASAADALSQFASAVTDPSEPSAKLRLFRGTAAWDLAVDVR